MDTLAVVLRSITVIMATGVAGFCISYLPMVRNNHYQRARFIGLALLSSVFVWGTFVHIYDPFNIRVPLYTIAFTISLYGTGFSKDNK